MILLSFISVIESESEYVSNYQEGLGSHVHGFNPTTFVCLSQARIWISNVIYHGLFQAQ